METVVSRLEYIGKWSTLKLTDATSRRASSVFAFQMDRGKRHRGPGPITGNTLLHLRTAGFIDVSYLSYLSLFVLSSKRMGRTF